MLSLNTAFIFIHLLLLLLPGFQPRTVSCSCPSNEENAAAVAAAPPQPPCSEYGFRCIKNRSSYELCDLEGDDKLLPPVEHHCTEGTICDESNPAFCSPAEDVLQPTDFLGKRNVGTTNEAYDDEAAAAETDDSSSNNNKRHSNALYLDYDGVDEDYVGCGADRAPVNEFQVFSLTNFPEEEDENKTEPPTDPAAMPGEDDNEQFIETCITEQAPFQCEISGYFADEKDKTRFYLCDVSDNGRMFKLHHMQCSDGRTFDAFRRECVLIGSTRNI